MNDVAVAARPRRPWRWILAIAVVAVAGAGTWYGYRYWQDQRSARGNLASQTQDRLAALEGNLAALRSDQRANARSALDAAATNRVLRDELLGLGQRNALLEQAVARLADTSRQGANALRQDEVELVLGQAQQRLLYAGDLDGARRLYALAAQLVEGLDQPGHMNLRQALIQERAALDALGPGARADAQAKLAALASALDKLPDTAPALASDHLDWWQKLLAPLVKVRPAGDEVLIARSERQAANDSLQLELSLARAAIERRDSAALEQAMERVDMWITRLWPDSPARRNQRQAVAQLRKLDLQPALPELGSTLQQLRSMREGAGTP